MAMTSRSAVAGKAPTDPLRRTAMIAGGLYLLTFASSIPARFYFLDPVLSDPGYIVGPGADTRVLVGGLLDMINALACIATAVVLFRVVKRQFGYTRTRYRGLAKNAAQVHMLVGLANLYLLRRRLLAA